MLMLTLISPASVQTCKTRNKEALKDYGGIWTPVPNIAELIVLNFYKNCHVSIPKI
jgi:hypothetical protein